MAREPEKQPAARLFVALDLPDGVRGAIAEWQQGALADPALRPVRVEGLHVTLCFLGHRPEEAIARTESVLSKVEPRPVALSFQAEPVALPKGRPGVYAIGVASEEAVALQGELSEALAAAGLLEPERRAFRPHVTIARVRSERLEPRKGERRGKGRPKRVRELPKPLGGDLLEPFEAVRVALYRSLLRPDGAEYVRLAELNLPSAHEAGER